MLRNEVFNDQTLYTPHLHLLATHIIHLRSKQHYTLK